MAGDWCLYILQTEGAGVLSGMREASFNMELAANDGNFSLFKVDIQPTLSKAFLI